MSYTGRIPRYRRPPVVALGFSLEDEQKILAAETDEGKKLDELLAIARRADTMRTITAISTVGGFLYGLVKISEIVLGKRREGFI